MSLPTVAIEELDTIKGVAVPRGVKLRQIIVTGPPVSGKSTLVSKLEGWPEEGYLDLAEKGWWQHRSLTFRPREVHFGFPFVGFRDSLTVFDDDWLNSPSKISLDRVQIPPANRGLFSINWRHRYVFDFQLLPPERIFELSRARLKEGTHPLDSRLTLELVELQVTTYETLALHFHRCGMRVYIRDQFEGAPKRFSEAARAESSH